jgi:hypothetical protein
VEKPAPKITRLVTGNTVRRVEEDTDSAQAFSRAMERLASADIVPLKSRAGG